MFQNILAILFILKFILKLVKRFEFYAPRFIQNHYGTKAKVDLKKLERLVCKIEKWKADIKFLRFCLIYRLCPKFTKFKLHKSSRQSVTQASALRKSLVTAKIKLHLKCVNSLESEFLTLKPQLSQKVGRFSFMYINRFLEQQKKEYEIKCFKIHQKKLWI